MLVEYRGGADEITEKGGQVYHLREYPATRHVLDTQEPTQIRVDNPADDAAERALLVQQGQKSLLMLPLVARGETIGLMEIVDVRDRVWDTGTSSSAAHSATSSPSPFATHASSPSCRRLPRATSSPASTTGGSSRSSSRPRWPAACARRRTSPS